MAQIIEGGLYQFLHRVGTADQWATSNTLLQRGEPGYEVDSTNLAGTRMKVGDGVHTWLDLPYVAGGLPELLAEAKLHADNASGKSLTDAKAYADAQSAVVRQHADDLDLANRRDWRSMETTLRSLINDTDTANRTDWEAQDARVLADAKDYVNNLNLGVSITEVEPGVYEVLGASVAYEGDGVYRIGE